MKVPLVPQLSMLLGWAGEHKVGIEVALMTLAHTPFLLFAAKNVVKPSHANFLRQPYYTLVVHHFVCIVELVHYYARLAALGRPPTATRFESALTAVQLATSLVLCAHVKKNQAGPRATMHMMFVQRLWAAGMAAYFNDAAWNRASIKLLDNFLWQRYFLRYGSRLAGMGTYMDRYRGGMVLWHTFTLWLVDYPYGIPMYVAGYLTLLSMNSYVTERMRTGKAGILLRTIDFFGFGSHPGDLDPQDDEADKKMKAEADWYEKTANVQAVVNGL